MPTPKKLQKLQHKCLRRAAILLLARREHSRQELRIKLQRKDFLLNDIDAVLDDLHTRDYQSDARFSEMLIRSRMRKGYGSIRIIAELKDRGVNLNIISNELDKYNHDAWHNVIIRIYQKKLASQSKIKNNKVIEYLLQRGFPYSLIKSTIISELNENIRN